MTTSDQANPLDASADAIERTQQIIEGWCSGPGMLSAGAAGDVAVACTNDMFAAGLLVVSGPPKAPGPDTPCQFCGRLFTSVVHECCVEVERLKALRHEATPENLARDLEYCGIAFSYDGQSLDPTRMIVHRADLGDAVTETQECDEWRLTILLDDGDSCTCIARGAEQLNELLDFCGENFIPEQVTITVARRHVTTTRTAWTEAEPPTLNKD